MLPTESFGPPGSKDALHRVIEVMFAGRRRTFLLDTGGGITAISPELAAEAGCLPEGRLTAYRMFGERVDMPQCENVTLSIGGKSIRLGEVGVFALSALIPPDWPHVDGLVSLHTFENQPVTFDFPRRTLVLETEQSLEARQRVMSPLDIRVARPAAGAALDVFFAVQTAHKKLWLIADSGSDAPLLLAPHAARLLGVELPLPDADAGAAGKGGVVKVPDVMLPIVGVRPARATATIREMIYDGNIGAPTLRSYVVMFDLRRGRAWAAAAGGD